MGLTEKKEYIQSIHPKLSHEYHVENKSITDISSLYGIGPAAVRRATDNYPRNEVKDLYGAKESVLMVDSRFLKEALFHLKEMGIDCRMVSKDHVLTETYKSKIG